MDRAIDEISALERAYDDLARVVGGLGAGDLSLPTNCPGWDVRALLNHTLGAAVMFTLVNEGHVADEDAGDLTADDPVGALQTTSSANVATWRASNGLDGERTYPWGTFPAAVGLRINISEIALHGWDLAKATDQDARIDPGVAGPVYDLYSQMPMDGLRAKGVFGAAVSVPASAPVGERLLGLLGRTR